jgi:DNA invertase Pin-like site-specific DNA recombinase
MHSQNFTGQRAVIYARISQDREGEGLGIERQQAACRQYADSQGMEVVEVLTDNDRSGYSGQRRPDFERLKELVRERSIDAVIYWKQDRLTRQAVEFLSFIELSQPKNATDPGVSLHTADGPVDTKSASGGLTAQMGAVIAQYESTIKRDRAMAKQRQKAEANEWLGGARPFGWNLKDGKLEVNESEAEALRQAAHDLLSGKSLYSIVRDWSDPDRAGGPLLSTLGRPVTVQSLKQMLRRTRNYGETVVEIKDGLGQVVMTNPPIMSRELVESVERFLSNPKRRKSKSNKAKYLLGGIAQCHCGEIVRTRSGTGRTNSAGETRRLTYYACPAPGEGHIAKQIQYVDTVVELFVFRALVKDRIAYADRPEVTEEVAQLRARLEQLSDKKSEGGKLFAEGSMDASQLKSFNESINTQIEEVTHDLEALEVPSYENHLGDIAQILREYKKNDAAFRDWRRMPLDDRREWIRRRFHVVLRSQKKGLSRTFDVDTVSVYERAVGEYGETIPAERVAELPLTPISDGGPPPSYMDLFTEETPDPTWAGYLNHFAAMSALGWMDEKLGIDPSVTDSRLHWRGNWKEPKPPHDDTPKT